MLGVSPKGLFPSVIVVPVVPFVTFILSSIGPLLTSKYATQLVLPVAAITIFWFFIDIVEVPVHADFVDNA